MDNLKYLIHRTLDELEDSENYVKMALEIQPMSKDWADKFLTLSVSEQDHAKVVFCMYQELYAKTIEAYSSIPRYLIEMNSEFANEYMERCSKVKLMHDIFKK